MSTPVPRLDALTGVRAYAALWVAIFHFIKNTGVVDQVTASAWILEGRWGVELFFILSGFVLTHVYQSNLQQDPSSRNFLRYLALRLGRIYPLHIATLFALVILVGVGSLAGMQPEHPENFTMQGLLWELLLIRAWLDVDQIIWNYVAWSISAEWFAYLFLLLPCVLWLRRVPGWLVIVGASLGWVLFFCTLATDGEWRYHDLYLHSVARVSVDFVIGYGLYRLWLQYRFSGMLSDIALVVATATVLALCYAPGPYRILLVPAMALLIYALASPGRLGQALFANKACIFLGDASYAIYMVHPLIQIVHNFIVRRLQLPDVPWIGISLLVIDFIVLIAVATLCLMLIERPCRDWVRARLDARKSAVPQRDGAFQGT